MSASRNTCPPPPPPAKPKALRPVGNPPFGLHRHVNQHSEAALVCGLRKPAGGGTEGDDRQGDFFGEFQPLGISCGIVPAIVHHDGETRRRFLPSPRAT